MQVYSECRLKMNKDCQHINRSRPWGSFDDFGKIRNDIRGKSGYVCQCLYRDQKSTQLVSE